MTQLSRVEYIKTGDRGYENYGYYNTLDEAKDIGEKLLDSGKARRVKIIIIPVHEGDTNE